MYKNNQGETVNEDVSKIMGSGEFNEQLYKLIKDKDINERPLICMGNYEQTGESITYVNDKYGIVNSVHILSSLGAAWKDYQRACRLNYKLGGFKSKEFPEKYLIGDEIVIDNALQIEKERDDHIDKLIEGGYSNLSQIVTNTNSQIDSHRENKLQQSTATLVFISIQLNYGSTLTRRRLGPRGRRRRRPPPPRPRRWKIGMEKCQF